MPIEIYLFGNDIGICSFNVEVWQNHPTSTSCRAIQCMNCILNFLLDYYSRILFNPRYLREAAKK